MFEPLHINYGDLIVSCAENEVIGSYPGFLIWNYLRDVPLYLLQNIICYTNGWLIDSSWPMTEHGVVTSWFNRDSSSEQIWFTDSSAVQHFLKSLLPFQILSTQSLFSFLQVLNSTWWSDIFPSSFLSYSSSFTEISPRLICTSNLIMTSAT